MADPNNGPVEVERGKALCIFYLYAMIRKRMKKLTHIDAAGRPQMVDVAAKATTERVAEASAEIRLGKEIVALIKKGDLITKKGPVIHTAIIAGVMAAKKTSELIPFCHPIALEDCQVSIRLEGNKALISTRVKTTGKTGVEMEALTAASVAALTIYDMCKAVSHNMIIGDIKLMKKSGGKNNFERKAKKVIG